MMTIFLSEKSILINNTLKSPGHPTNYTPNSTFHSDDSIQDRSFLLLLNSSGTVKILWHISRQTTTKYYYLFCVVRVYTREMISIKLRIASVFVGCKRVSRWSKMQFVLSHKRGTKNEKICTILFNYQLKIYSVDTMDDSSRWWLYREKYMGARRYGISLRTGERSEQVRCRVEHEKRNFISASNDVLFVYHINTITLYWQEKSTLSTNENEGSIIP